MTSNDSILALSEIEFQDRVFGNGYYTHTVPIIKKMNFNPFFADEEILRTSRENF